MPAPCVVLDTNVLVAAAKSRRGASFRALSLVGTGQFDIAVAVPLVLEYEATLLRLLDEHAWSDREVGDVIDYLCSAGRRTSPTYLWRPTLPDPGDEHILDLAVAARCDAIVTFNRRDFRGVDAFGIAVWTPGDLLRRIGER